MVRGGGGPCPQHGPRQAQPQEEIPQQMAPKSHVIVIQRRPGGVTCEAADDVVKAGPGLLVEGGPLPGLEHNI